jgi:uncharacterized protein
MTMTRLLFTALIIALVTTVSGCSAITKPLSQRTPMFNPVAYFEIPVTDLQRAVRFYSAVFEYSLDLQTIDGYEMALFPFADGAPGASGALAKGDVYVPAKTGPIVYFRVSSIDQTIARATSIGAKALFNKKSIGEAGFVAEIEDSEGNRVALLEPLEK